MAEVGSTTKASVFKFAGILVQLKFAPKLELVIIQLTGLKAGFTPKRNETSPKILQIRFAWGNQGHATMQAHAGLAARRSQRHKRVEAGGSEGGMVSTAAHGGGGGGGPAAAAVVAAAAAGLVTVSSLYFPEWKSLFFSAAWAFGSTWFL